MEKIRKAIEKISSGRGIYVVSAVTFCLIVGAIALIYNASLGMLGDLDLPRVATTAEQARQNLTDEADPRYTKGTMPQTTEKTTQATTAKAAATTATKQTTTAVYTNDSFMLPVDGEILKGYSTTPVYDETMEDYRSHRGIDFFCEKGETVVSVGNGKVVKVTSHVSDGYCVEIDYGSFIGRYCGLEQGTTLKINDTVKKGDAVGKLDTMPSEVKQQSHLHFETVVGDEYIDPVKALGMDK